MSDKLKQLRELRASVEELLDVVEEAIENEASYVQVAFSHGGFGYTYRDPSGELTFDENVVVPVGYGNRPTIGHVVALGRGNWSGECKAVMGRVQWLVAE